MRIIVRGDSGFCRWKLMRWCEQNGVFYLLGLARNQVLERQAAPFLAAAQTQFSATQQKVRNFYELRYAAQTWDQPRRVIIKAEHLPEGPNVRFVVTNLPRLDPARVYDKLYVARGDMENRIKEPQLALFADRTSCQAFPAAAGSACCSPRRLTSSSKPCGARR